MPQFNKTFDMYSIISKIESDNRLRLPPTVKLRRTRRLRLRFFSASRKWGDTNSHILLKVGWKYPTSLHCNPNRGFLILVFKGKGKG